MGMIPQEFQLTTLPYVLVCAAATSVALRRKTPSRLNAAVAAIVVLLLVKMVNTHAMLVLHHNDVVLCERSHMRLVFVRRPSNRA